MMNAVLLYSARRVRHIALSLLLLMALPVLAPFMLGGPAQARETEFATLQEEQAAAGGSCGWEAFRQAVRNRESTNNPTARNDDGYAGWYQFGEARLQEIGWYCSKPVCSTCYQAFKGAWCQKAKNYGVNSIEDFMNNQEAQDAAFLEHMQKHYRDTKKCQDKLGQPAPGQSCNMTLSGTLGAAHLGGAGGSCKYVDSGSNPSDNLGTSVGAYMCCFRGFQICDTVAPGDPSCNDGSDGGTCGNPDEEACQGGATGSGREDENYELGKPGIEDESGHDLDVGPDVTHLSDLSESLKSIWVASLQIMTSQLTAVMMEQVQAIGMLFDAKQQLEVQRLMQQRTAEAHKDYQPSEQMCEIGTMVRHLATTERQVELSQVGMAKRMLERELASGDALTMEGQKSDMKSRLKHMREDYCNSDDNGKHADNICNDSTVDAKDRNRDIDYATTLDNPMTLELNLADNHMTRDEENLMELVNYLFMNRALPVVPPGNTSLKRFVTPYQDARSLIAMRGVARNSIATIIAQKTQPTDHEGDAAPFMRALMKDMGIEGEEMDKMFGKNPSYYAQMEVLTKKIYQNPNFIMNLYDKPANVMRIRTAMQAIKTMQDRDIHEAMMRREMLLSMILEARIRQNQQKLMEEIRGNLYRTTSGPR